MLEAPLFFAQYGKLMEYFNLYHAGVGFVNTNSKQNWTVEVCKKNYPRRKAN